MEENNTASTADDGSQDARTKMLRAARMKSLYVAVSQRPQSLAEIEVTPYGRIKKVRANSSDMDGYDPSRGSTMSYADFDSEYRPSELLERDSTFFHNEQDELDEEEENQELQQANREVPGVENEDYDNQFEGSYRDGEEEGSADYAASDAPRSRSSSRSVSPTVPATSFAPVGARKVGFVRSANDQDNDTVGSGSSGTSASKNALENARSRRASTTKKPVKEKPRATSGQSLLQRGSSASVFEMFAGIGGGGVSANYIEEAGCTSALEVLQSTSRQPLVRRLFENYCKSDETLDVNLVQQLCYDVGIYYSLLDIRISIKPFVHNTQYIMTDDSFLVWWRSNSDFR